MDYQTSSFTSFKVVISHYGKVFVFIVLMAFGFTTQLFAQTTTNPLSAEVTISAAVLVNSSAHPDTPPVPPAPGPINMTGVTDSVIFTGFSYPESIVSILQNGVIVASLPVHDDGSFEVHVRSLNSGIYTFGIRAEDKDKNTSKLLTFTVYVSSGVATTVSGIFIPPTITSDKIEGKKGENILLRGSGVPNAEIRLSLVSSFEVLRKAITNASGTWSYILDTTSLDLGDYTAKARSLNSDNLSLYSDSLQFRIGDTTRFRNKASTLAGFRKRCDLNDDNRVNLVDFSIMAFWYKRLGFPDRVDLNTDKQVNLTDLSILAFCWTG